MKVTKKFTLVALILILVVTARASALYRPLQFNLSLNEEGSLTNTLPLSTPNGITNEISDTKNIQDSNLAKKEEYTTVTAFIVSINNHEITLDYVDVFSGENAIKQMMIDGLCTREADCLTGIPIYERNVNPKLRTFPLSKNVLIFDDRNRELTLSMLSSPNYISSLIKEGEFSDHPNSEHRIGALFVFTLNAKNEVIKIVQQFRA